MEIDKDYKPDFEYEPIYLKRPNGSIMTAFKIVDLPKGKTGVISRNLKERLVIDKKNEE